MSPEFWLGVAAILTTIIIAVGGFLIRHAIQDAQDKGEIRTEISNIKEQIGTHDSGLRGESHKLANMMSRMRAVVYFLGRKLDIDIMKDLDDEK